MNWLRVTAMCAIAAAATVGFTVPVVHAEGFPIHQPCPCRHASYLLAQLPDSALTLDTGIFLNKSEKTALRYSVMSAVTPTAHLIGLRFRL